MGSMCLRACRPCRLVKGLIVYSFPFVCALWAIVGIVAGWAWATNKDYRDPAAARGPINRPQKPVAALNVRAVGVARVPGSSHAPLALAAPCAGVVGSSVVRTRIRHHSAHGSRHYAPRARTMLELAA